MLVERVDEAGQARPPLLRQRTGSGAQQRQRGGAFAGTDRRLRHEAAERVADQMRSTGPASTSEALRHDLAQVGREQVDVVVRRDVGPC